MKRRIRGLTLHTPWPWAIFGLPDPYAKRLENRGFAPPTWMRGQYLALHAGKTWDYHGAARIKAEHPEMPGSQSEHPLGIIGVARIGRVFADLSDPDAGITGAIALPPGQRRWYFGGDGYAWELLDVLTFQKPVPCRGMQGLWTIDDAPGGTLFAVRAAFDAARKAAGGTVDGGAFENARAGEGGV